MDNGTRHRRAQSLDGPAKKALLSLTRCETRVLSLVTQSKTNNEIARALGISPATVKRHVENILRKLGARNRVEAAIYGLFLKRCPAGNRLGCPLEQWQKTRESENKKWADWPTCQAI